MILKELSGFGWFMRNGKHFHISPMGGHEIDLTLGQQDKDSETCII